MPSQSLKKTYKKSKIPGYGPDEAPIYYFDLTSIAIDWLKSFKAQHLLGRGWNKIPKNATDGKMKIIQRLLQMRKYNDQTQLFELEQTVLLGQLQNVWGYAQPPTQLHHNDRIRLFGILMTLPHNLAMYTRLAEGINNRAVFDDPKMHPKQMFTKMAQDFNNDDLVITLPTNASDVEGYDTLDPNDHSRMRIHRDRKCFCFVYSIF